MSETLFDHMRERAQTCRRLAEATYDERVKSELLTIADSIEGDIRRFEEESGAA